MKTVTKSRAISYVVGLFVLAALAGGFAGYSAGRERSFRPPKPHDMAAHILKGMEGRLKLKPEQTAAILPIIQRDCDQIGQLQKECTHRINEAINASHKDIAALLTPEQRAELAAMDKERNSRMNREGDGRRDSRRDPRPPGKSEK